MSNQQLSFDIREYYKKVRLEMKTYNTSREAIQGFFHNKATDFISQFDKKNNPIFAKPVPYFFLELSGFIDAERMSMGAYYKEYKNNPKVKAAIINDDLATKNAAAVVLSQYYFHRTDEIFKMLDGVKDGDVCSTVDVDVFKEQYLLNEQIYNCFRSDPIISSFLGFEDATFSNASNNRILYYRQYRMSCIGLIFEEGVFDPASEEEIQTTINNIKVNIQRLYFRFLLGKEPGKSGEEILIRFKKSMFSQIKNKRVLLEVLPTINGYEPLFENGFTLLAIDVMSGNEFEIFTASLLQRIGYSNVVITKTSGDQGVDVIAERGGIRYAIQCKCYSSDLGNTPVQEVNAGKVLYNCHVGVVITNRYFTKGAKELAAATGTLLWDRDKLAEMLQELNQVI